MDEIKESWKPKFKSEFSMGEYDFKEYSEWQHNSNLSSASIQSCQVPSLEQVQKYFAELNALYMLWKPLISSKELREKFRNKKLGIRKMKRLWEQSIESGVQMNKNFIFKIVDELDSFHEELLEIKQIIGLGIVVKKSLSTKEKIKYGIKPKRDFSDLPEV